MMPYEKFEAWKATHDLALAVYRATETWPKTERELSYLLRFGKDRGILDEETFQRLDQLRNRAGTLTWRLYACLARAASR